MGLPWPAFLRRDADNPRQHVALRLFLAEGLLSGVAIAGVETFLPLFALALGASAADLGAMVAISHVLGPPTYLLAGIVAERSARHQRLYVIIEGVVGRAFMLLYPLVPLFMSGRAAVLGLIALHVVRMTFFRLGVPAQMAVTGSVVPAPLRGRFMSARSLAASLGELIIQPMLGMIIAATVFPRGYQIGFALAWLIGSAGIYLFARMPMPAALPLPPPRAAGATLRGWGQDLRADRRLLAFLLVVLAWGLGEQTVRSFYSVHMVRDLDLGAGTIGWLASAASLAALVGLPLVGLLSDRRSNRVALVVTGGVIVFTNLLWLVARSVPALVCVYLLTGLVRRGFQVAQTNLLLSIAPPASLARYSALYEAVATVTSVVGPLLGGVLFEHLGFGSNLVWAIVCGLVALAIAARMMPGREKIG
jgi:MFS family permease